MESLRLESLPKPEPSSSEVVVRVRAAGVNPYDWMTRRGDGADVELPWIPGWDISGTVQVVGEDVTAFEAGDDVFSMLRDERGAYAEYVAVPAENLVRKPESLAHTEAAAVPMGALTAWQALFDDGALCPDQRVLVHAAAGGVGHIAVQLARWNGSRTVGTASESNREFLDELGLDAFVNYRRVQFEDVVEPVDLVIDAVGGDTLERSLQVLRSGGHVSKLPAHLTATESELVETHGSTASYPIVRWKPEQLRTISHLIDVGALTVRVGQVFPLEDVGQAHELSQSRHLQGKIVLEL